MGTYGDNGNPVEYTADVTSFIRAYGLGMGIDARCKEVTCVNDRRVMSSLIPYTRAAIMHIIQRRWVEGELK